MPKWRLVVVVHAVKAHSTGQLSFISSFSFFSTASAFSLRPHVHVSHQYHHLNIKQLRHLIMNFAIYNPLSSCAVYQFPAVKLLPRAHELLGRESSVQHELEILQRIRNSLLVSIFVAFHFFSTSEWVGEQNCLHSVSRSPRHRWRHRR